MEPSCNFKYNTDAEVVTILQTSEIARQHQNSKALITANLVMFRIVPDVKRIIKTQHTNSQPPFHLFQKCSGQLLCLLDIMAAFLHRRYSLAVSTFNENKSGYQQKYF